MDMRVYTAADGKKYNMSLQNECMKCHSNKAQFCDQCHNYMAVTSHTAGPAMLSRKETK